MDTISDYLTSWEDIQKELFTPAQIARCNKRVQAYKKYSRLRRCYKGIKRRYCLSY